MPDEYEREKLYFLYALFSIPRWFDESLAKDMLAKFDTTPLIDPITVDTMLGDMGKAVPGALVRNPETATCSVHPILQTLFNAVVRTSDPADYKAAHGFLIDWYRDRAGRMPDIALAYEAEAAYHQMAYNSL